VKKDYFVIMNISSFNSIGITILSGITRFARDMDIAFSSNSENCITPHSLQCTFFELNCLNPKVANDLLRCFHNETRVPYQDERFCPSKFPEIYHKGFNDRIEMLIRNQKACKVG
jgi:hypothetical protein